MEVNTALKLIAQAEEVVSMFMIAEKEQLGRSEELQKAVVLLQQAIDNLVT